jgi:hypothetical protein
MPPIEYDPVALRAASELTNKLLKFNYQRTFGSAKPSVPNGLLFHYTTAGGLKGIIESNELWASSAYFLNDSSEITYGYALLTEVLDQCISDNPRNEDSLSLGIARDFRQSFGQDRLKMEIVELVFLACFCEEDDLLSQWRNYGQTGGYSLGFGLSITELTPEPNTYTSDWVKVVYDRSEQIKRCRSILDSVLPIFDDPDAAKAIAAVESHPQVGYPAIRRIIADILMEEVAALKNKAFESEKEWRIVVRKRELMKQGTDDAGKTPLAIHFRLSHDALVPYVRLTPFNRAHKLPISRVRSGPTLDRATAGMAVSMMLEKHGFSNVRIGGSDIPVRKI